MKYILALLFTFIPYLIYSQSGNSILDEYLNNRQYLQALHYIDSQEADKDLLFNKALCYKGLDNYKQAAIILKGLIEEYPDDKKIRLELANCYTVLSNWDNALENYETLLEQDSVNVFYKMQRADILFRKNNFREALSSYQSLTNHDNLTNMLSRSAQCFEQLNLPDSAIVYYKKAWAVDSTDAFSVARLINLNLKSNLAVIDIKEKSSPIHNAVKYSNIYMARDTTNQQINLLNALAYYTMQNYEEAIPRFERCYLRGDSTLVLNRSLGISYYYMGQNENAYLFLKKAYEQDSANINVMYCLGTVCNDLQEYESAVIYFSKILERVVPADLTLYSYYRGHARALEGNKEFQPAVENYIIAEKYAAEKQKIALFFSIATLYDYDLDQPGEALSYYYKYRESMEQYLQELIDKDAEDEEIKDMESKLRGLSSHIKRLEKKIQ